MRARAEILPRPIRTGPAQPDWSELNDRARRLAREVAPNVPPRSKMAEARRRFRSAATAAANARENRARLRRGDEALRPLFYIWTMLNACNFACTYCDNHRGQKYPDLPNRGALGTEAGKELLRVMRTGTSALYFCGGEPTLRVDLPALTEEARRLSYWPMMINTNGSRFHKLLPDPAWAEWLSKIDVIIVSLDALSLDVLRDLYVTKTPEDVIANVLALRMLAPKAGFKLVLNTVIQPGLIEEARAVRRFCEDIGAWFSYVPLNAGSSMAGGLREDPEYRLLAREIVERAARGGKIVGGPRLARRLLWSQPVRCVPTTFVHVNPDGSVYWPCKPAVNVSPVYVSALGKTDLEQIWAEGRRSVEPTGFVGPAPDQCGGECRWLQHYVVDAYVGLLRDPRRYGWVLPSLLRSVAAR